MSKFASKKVRTAKEMQPISWFWLIAFTKIEQKYDQTVTYILHKKPLLYSCNKITTTQIQNFRQNWNGLFSNISHQMMIKLTPIVSRAKSKWYKPKKVIKLALNSQLLTSNFDKQCSGGHFMSFLFYYYCKISSQNQN